MPKMPEGNKCRNLHGHSYRVKIYIKGEVNNENGMLIDFGEIKRIVSPLISELDHSLLNDKIGLENPTSENLSIWIWNKIISNISLLSKVEVCETCTSGCIYEGK